MARVVLADDEEFVRYFIKPTIESFGYDVVAEVEDGLQLIEVMKEYNPDILLLDINMPGMSGLDFLKEHYQDYPRTCVIMLTAVINKIHIEHCEKFGAKYFLRKDTDITEMMLAIEATWEKFKKENW